ncbi:MAG: CDP-alcohol phosphatidyltransferase family protein [Ruminococcus sp.]|nr:CDP-alcohol phosphatidyltransferase family protein [Ruminococcus sp.]
MKEERKRIDKIVKERVDTTDLITVPNILSFMRILLIIPFAILFLNDNYIWSTIMIVISGLSDCVDGLIARSLHQVSEFGKILDPIADKLTLLSVGICICIKIPEVITVMVILIIKDLLMLAGATSLLKRGIRPPQARWYGKLGTILFYISVGITVFMKIIDYNIPYLSVTLLSITAAAMIFALFKYFVVFLDLLQNSNNSSDENQEQKGA